MPFATPVATVRRLRRGASAIAAGRGRRAWLVGLAAGLGVLLIAFGVVAATRSGGHATTAPVAVSTYTIERRDLVATETAAGTLGFDLRAATIVDRLGGTITNLPVEGSIVQIGGVLYRVGSQPVVLLRGQVPASRTLAEGVDDGADVRQLEQNLRALGFDPYRQMRIDGHFSAATRAIVERWQRATGMAVAGTVDLGRIVFATGPVRIGKVEATVGSSGGPVMNISATQPVVTVKLDTSLEPIVTVGDPVQIELPGGRAVAGRVTEVGRVATASENASSGATIDVSVTLKRAKGVEHLDQAPVSVSFVKERRAHVLAVPVTALLAQTGGYAVETVTPGGNHQLVPVQVGLFASGFVEIQSKTITPGTKVVVPSS